MNTTIDPTHTTTFRAWPCLAYQDARRAIAFLTDAFGFTTAAVFEEGDAIRHAQLRWKGAGAAMLGSVRGSQDGDVPIQPTGRNCVYLVADSAAEVDAIFARASSAGATVVKEPFDTHYGSHDFAVADPEGNLWTFGTYAGA